MPASRRDLQARPGLNGSDPDLSLSSSPHRLQQSPQGAERRSVDRRLCLVVPWLSRGCIRRGRILRTAAAGFRWLARTVRRSPVPGMALMAAGLWACGILAPPIASAQTVRALVIGIDDYGELRDLAGAVNDARDIAKALSKAGVQDLTVLKNLAATRQRISGEWRALVARARPGDTLVLTYAGHGGQEPARVAGTERDGLDEVLLLGGFRSSGPGTRERIPDDELNRWFSEAGERNLRVIFVADSCHAGTLTRSIDSRAPTVSVRTARYTIGDDMLELEMPEAAAAIEEADLAHVSFLAAGQEYEQVPEVALPREGGGREPRGALSYMFARAVEGEADLDRDGILRRSELWRFVRENVRMVSEARQTPNLLPNDRGGEPLLRLASQSPPPSSGADSASSASPSSLADTNGTSRRLRLAVLNATPAVRAAVSDRLPQISLVSRREFPDLIWDAGARQAITGMGDVAAHDVGLAALSATVGKWEAVRAVKALSARAALRIRVHPHDGVHRRGDEMEIEVDGLRHPRLTLLGVSGNGTVHYLYPLPSDPAEVAVGRPFRLKLKATPPFGADHVVAISADSSLRGLNAQLVRLDGRRAARRAAKLIADAAIQARGWQSGIQGLFTAP